MLQWAALGALVGWLAAQAGSGEKPQAVRVLDVTVLGPALIALALRRGARPQDRRMLALAGGATVTYNAVNWWRKASGD